MWGMRSTRGKLCGARLPLAQARNLGVDTQYRLDRYRITLNISFYFHTMVSRCLGCGNTYESKRGLLNHRRTCYKWQNFDGVAKYKKRRLAQEKQTLGPDSVNSLQVPSETAGQAQPLANDLSLEVRKWLVLGIIIDYSLAYRMQSRSNMLNL
jgi:hypothetical protein